MKHILLASLLATAFISPALAANETTMNSKTGAALHSTSNTRIISGANLNRVGSNSVTSGAFENRVSRRGTSVNTGANVNTNLNANVSGGNAPLLGIGTNGSVDTTSSLSTGTSLRSSSNSGVRISNSGSGNE